MSWIPLSQGRFAIVDDEDYKELSKHKWCAAWNPGTRSFYAVRSIRLTNGKRRQELMHRRILGLKHGDKRQCDHIYHKTLDNRRDRIRIVTPGENTHNRYCKGYSWDRANHKFLAQIAAGGINKHLGRYDTPAEARAAYLAAKREYHPSAPQGLLLEI